MDRLTVGSQQHRFRLQTKLNRTVVSAKAEIKCREVRRPSGIDSLIGGHSGLHNQKRDQ
jgi:hypothetical protein